MSLPQPILQNSDAVNGIMEIEIVNLDDVDDGELEFGFIFSFKFQLQNNNAYVYIYYDCCSIDAWKAIPFNIGFINQRRTFSVKVPLFLFPYSMEYKLEMKTFVFDQDDDNEYTECSNNTSKNYTTNIPSILMETQYKIGDHIQYKLGNKPLTNGSILEVNESTEMIKIKMDEKTDIVTIPACQVLRFPTHREHLLDITNRNPAHIELILRTNVEERIDFFLELAHYLARFYYNILDLIEEEHVTNDFFYLSHLIATHIYEFLYCPEYNYRLHCILDGGDLYYGNAWKDYVATHFGYDFDSETYTVTDLEDVLDGKCEGYTCDICRCEICRYDFIFSCADVDEQVFCVSCVHSIVMQYNEMKPFLADLLMDILDHNCIEEIVTFCVGKVLKFDIKNKNIDDHKSTVLKRNI